MHSQAAELLTVVKRGDAVEIEGARDRVRPDLLPDLLAAYGQLTTWEDKAGLMQLFSDYLTTGGERVMRDFLRAPTTEINDEYYTSGKIVALCQLAGTFEIYERLWVDRSLCAAVIDRVLAGQRPSPDMVDRLDADRQPAPPAKPASRPKPLDRLLRRLTQRQRNALSIVFLVAYAAAGFALLAFILADTTRVFVVAALLGVGIGAYLLYGALAPKMTCGQPPALRWLLGGCGTVALALGLWAAVMVVGGQVDAQPSRRLNLDPAMLDWASVAVIGTLLVLPLMLTWGVMRLWARRERALRQAAQQAGEVFAIEPLARVSLLFGGFGMLAFSVFAAIAGLNGARTGFRYIDSMIVAGIFALIGVGMLAFARHTSGLVVLTAQGIAVRRLGMRQRFVRYDEVDAVRLLSFGVPPNMVLRGRGRTVRIPRTVRDLPRLYRLLSERVPALRWAAGPRLQRFTLPERKGLLGAIDRWLLEPQTLIALELSRLQIRYRCRGEAWRTRPSQDIAHIAWEKIEARRRFSTKPQINLPAYNVLIVFGDGERLRIRQPRAIQFGTTPEALYVTLRTLYA